jgi:hypothetical protein
MLLLLIFPAAGLLGDTHRLVADGKIDFSAFKTFVVREGYPTSGQPSSGNQGTNRTPDVDPKLIQAVRDALRSTFSSRGMKETLDSVDLIVNFRIEVATQPKEVRVFGKIGKTSAECDKDHAFGKEEIMRYPTRPAGAAHPLPSGEGFLPEF